MSDDPSISQQAQGSYIAQATHGGTATVQVVLPPAPVQEQNRVRFLARLRYQYGALWDQSLQGAALLTLGLTKKPDAVLHHTGLLFLSSQQPERPLPPGTSIDEVYDEAGHELLILGEPGAGKSTLLLALARKLVERAEQDAQHPIPVILPLSSWAQKRLPLTIWLAEQLSLLYDVPLRVSHGWLQTNQVLPLLDGLDEVPEQVRRGCIEAIIAYRKEHLVPLVVCSRRAEYEEIERSQRLVLHCAVVIEPLSREQVETSLDRAGQSLAAVRAVLRANPMLEELVTTPLMLSVVTLAYANAPVEDLPQHGSANIQQQQIFGTYIERMIERKGNRMLYPLEPTKAWLGWLARQMRVHNQTVFYIEHMQPDWLVEQPETRQLYPRIVVGLIFGLLGFVVLGPLWGGTTSFVIAFLSATVKSFNLLLIFGLALLFTLAGGSILGLINGLLYKERQVSTTQRQRRRKGVRPWIARSLLNGLLVGLLFGVPSGFITGYAAGDPLTGVLIVSLLMGITNVFLFGLLDGLLAIQTITIQPAEMVAWSWMNMWRNLVKFLFFGLLSALLLGLLLGLVLALLSGNFVLPLFWHSLSENLQFGLKMALASAPFFALLGALLGGLIGGLSSDVLDKRHSAVPNQGIRRSARHSLLVGMVSLLVVAVITVPLVILFGGAPLWLMFFIGILVSVVSALRAGGTACIQHYVLRWLLWKDTKMPWHYVRFLEEATERILLQRVGGGYRFIHPLFQDYFASLSTPAPPSAQPLSPQ